MPTATQEPERTMVVPEPPSTLDAASWLPMPSWLTGIASIGGVFGLIPHARERFKPDVDAWMLLRDRQMLALEFKRSYRGAAHERGEQQHLFDPDGL